MLDKEITQDIAETGTVNLSVLGVTTFAEIEMILKIILLVATIVYTAQRMYAHHKKNKNK